MNDNCTAQKHAGDLYLFLFALWNQQLNMCKQKQENEQPTD